MTNALVVKANGRPVGEYQLGYGFAHVVASLHNCPAAPTLDAACKTELQSVWPRRDNTLHFKSRCGVFLVTAEVVLFVEREWCGAQWFVSEPVRLEQNLSLPFTTTEELHAPVFVAFMGKQFVAIAAPGVVT